MDHTTVDIDGPDAIDGSRGGATALTRAVTRGASRHLMSLGYACMPEFTLKNGRRADILALNNKGAFCLVEVKTAVSDFRSDDKWPDYLDFCDAFYFAVDLDFPLPILESAIEREPRIGIMVGDGYGADIIRPASTLSLHASRRKRLTVQFGYHCATRLHSFLDPRL